MRITEKGSVLLEVIVMGVIIAFLAANMATLLLNRYYTNQRMESENVNSKMAYGAWMNLVSGWSGNPGSTQACQSNASYTCGGSAPGCASPQSCTCTPKVAGNPTIYACSNGTNYSVQIVTPP